MVWVWLLDTQFGLVNQYLGLVGISAVPWLTSVDWALVGVSIASIWWDLGLAFVIFLAALQDVPRDLHEAAAIDGAGRLRQFWHVTLPHLRPAISMVVTLQLIASLRIFSQVYVMTNGGPNGASQSVIHYVYQIAIVQYRLGYASAVSMLLFALILALTILQRLVLRERAAWLSGASPAPTSPGATFRSGSAAWRWHSPGVPPSSGWSAPRSSRPAR